MALRLVRKNKQSTPEPAHTRSQDEDLVKELYDQHSAALFAYSLRLTSGDRHWAEDIVQEVLLRAWRNAGKLDVTTSSLRPWLFTVARRMVIDGQRRRKARPPRSYHRNVLPRPHGQ